MDETQVVDALGQVRQQVGDRYLPVCPRGLNAQGLRVEVAVLPLKRDQLVDPGHRLAVALDQLGLVVPGVEMADRAGAEDLHHPLRLRREVRRGRERILDLCPEKAVLREQRAQRHAPEASGHLAEETAAVEELAADRRQGDRHVGLTRKGTVERRPSRPATPRGCPRRPAPRRPGRARSDRNRAARPPRSRS